MLLAPEVRARIVRSALITTVVMLGAIAAARLSYEFHRLLFLPFPDGAIDLLSRKWESTHWMNGSSTYGFPLHGIQPPATYAMVQLLVGPYSDDTARWIWALLSALLLVLQSWMILRATRALPPLWRAAVVLTPLAGYSIAIGVGVGQLSLLSFVTLSSALYLFYGTEKSWRSDAAIAALFVVALIKPNIAAPFFWLLLCAPTRLRPAGLVLFGYAGLHCLALVPRDSAIGATMWWIDRTRDAVIYSVGQAGNADVSTWMTDHGYYQSSGVVSLLILAAIGVWVALHIRAAPLLQVGVVTLAMRFWVFHGFHDDLLLLLPMLALLSVAREAAPGSARRRIAAALLGMLWVGSLVPLSSFFLPAFKPYYRIGFSVSWLLALLVLALETRRSASAARSEDTGSPSARRSPAGS